MGATRAIRFVLAAALIAGAGFLAQGAAAQSLPNQVLSLYPQQTGELVFVDARALRASPHYARIKSQVLPDRFRSLEQWVEVLGISFDKEVRQLSWAFIPAAGGASTAPAGASQNSSAGIGFVGIAEGQFSLAEIETKARGLKLAITKPNGVMVVSLGKNDQATEFVFAFVDAATAVFGSRSAAGEILTRRAQGGASLLDNAAMREQITPLNGRAPIWFVLDRRFSALALKQMLPEASQVQGFDAVAARLQSTTLRFDLRNGLTSQANVRCQDASDAMVLSTAAQAAFAYQALAIRDKSPELSQAFSQVRINRSDARLELEFAVPEAQFVALLAKNGLALKF